MKDFTDSAICPRVSTFISPYSFESFIRIDFLIISFCIFVIIKLFERFKSKKEVVSDDKKSDEVLILEEIRDLLKKD